MQHLDCDFCEEPLLDGDQVICTFVEHGTLKAAHFSEGHETVDPEGRYHEHCYGRLRDEHPHLSYPDPG